MWSLESTWPFGDDEDEPKTPVRVVGSWTDAVLHRGGQKAQRGFGGRLMFYDKEGETPVLVEGQLVVYAFDETNREPTDNKPTRRYVFPADQVSRHMSKSEVGPSYSFWLPWDEDGGAQTEISLVARFEPKDGPVVVGEQTRHLLPGKLTASAIAAATGPPRLPEGTPSRPVMPQLPQGEEPTVVPTPSPVQQASYEGAVAPPTPQRRMTTTSISLPDRMGRSIGPVTAPAAMPTAPPTVAPISAQPAAIATPTATQSGATAFTQPVPGMYQRQPLQAGFQPMPQSPFAGKAMYGTPPQTPQTNALGPQLPASPAESRWETTVSYGPAEGAAGPAAPAGQAPAATTVLR
jgi:hypothetical protein